MFALFNYYLEYVRRILRIRRGHYKILSVMLEYPDLDPFSPELVDYIQRMTSLAGSGQFGSLWHYLSTQSVGRVHFSNSEVVRLPNLLPPWNDVFDPPPEPGKQPVLKMRYDLIERLSNALSGDLPGYDIVILYYNGPDQNNAITSHLNYTIARKFLWFTVKYSLKLPTVMLRGDVVQLKWTRALYHEFGHALQFLHHAGRGHIPLLDGNQSSTEYVQRNPFHSLGKEDFWEQTVPFFNVVAVGISALNCDRYGWYRRLEVMELSAPLASFQAQLYTNAALPGTTAGPPVYLIKINTMGFGNHAPGYLLEARAKTGYDSNIVRSGVLVYKLDVSQGNPALGLLPYLLRRDTSARENQWEKYPVKENEVLDHPGLSVKVVGVSTDNDGVPLFYDLNITVSLI